MRQTITTVVDQLLLPDLVARCRDDQGLDRLAPSLVRNTDDGHFRHSGMGEQRILHLDRRHVLTARDDDVFLAIDDRQVELVVDPTAIARMEPTALECLGRLGRLIPVAGEDHVAAGQHLSLIVGLQANTNRRRSSTSKLDGTLAR